MHVLLGVSTMLAALREVTVIATPLGGLIGGSVGAYNVYMNALGTQADLDHDSRVYNRAKGQMASPRNAVMVGLLGIRQPRSMRQVDDILAPVAIGLGYGLLWPVTAPYFVAAFIYGLKMAGDEKK